MKYFKGSLLIVCLIVSGISLKAQSFSTNVDSVNATKQFILNPNDDSTDVITLYNNTAGSLQLKVMLSYEDIGAGVAFVEFYDAFPHQIVSNFGIGFTDSIVVGANDTVNFKGVMAVSGPAQINKLKLTVYDPLDSINSHRVLTFSEVICGPSAGNVIVNPLGSFCSMDSVFLSASGSYSNFQWSTGDTIQTIYVPANLSVFIEVSDSLGCISKDTSDIDVSIPFDEQICIVSVDSATGKNIVVWEKTPLQGTDQYYVYKESVVAGVYNLIGLVDYDSLSVFIDVASNPLQQSARYKISAVDSCGTESAKSNDHKTIHLTASIGTSNENNLVWDGYQGFSFPTYNIYRGPTPAAMTLLNSVASTMFTYSDLTPLSGNNYYRIEAVRTSTCTPTQKPTAYPSSVSNQVTLNPLGLDELGTNRFHIYPNPTVGEITIDLGTLEDRVEVLVKNALGQVVVTKELRNQSKFTIDIADKPGVYFVDIKVDNLVLKTQKIVCQ